LVPADGWRYLATGKVTVGLASHWPCITDISGFLVYRLKASEREMKKASEREMTTHLHSLVECLCLTFISSWNLVIPSLI